MDSIRCGFSLGYADKGETEVATKITHTARRVGALNLRQTLLHGPDHLVAAGPRCGLLAFDVVAEQ